MTEPSTTETNYPTFGEVLKQLNLEEAQLKALVNERKLRCFYEGSQRKFSANEVATVEAQLSAKGANEIKRIVNRALSVLLGKSVSEELTVTSPVAMQGDTRH